MKICSITGHRDIPENKVDYVKYELEKEIVKAVNDGYTHFISGMARGIDLYFAMLVIKLKQLMYNLPCYAQNHLITLISTFRIPPQHQDVQSDNP